jgi:aromatic ring hydroxylase
VDQIFGFDLDVYVHVEKETDAGVIVSGAKCVATGSALTHHNFIGYYGLTPATAISRTSWVLRGHE